MNPTMPFLRWMYDLRVRQALKLPIIIVDDSGFFMEIRPVGAYNFVEIVEYMVNLRVAISIYDKMCTDWWEAMMK